MDTTITTDEIRYLLGVDVGSTTVKCIVVEPDTFKILWHKYERHETRQAEKVLELLTEAAGSFPDLQPNVACMFVTGSGAGPLTKPLGARFVQEVNAVSLAVEKLHPEVSSVIELGGQDAKIVLFKTNPETGQRQIITSMNDKCASGTGATIDKCLLKVGMSHAEVAGLQFDASRLHHVAAKCGVFAETDVVNLIKSGVPSDEIMNSLADAIVMQNLSVLTRGNTLQEKVLLLGGPNTYLPFLQQCWRVRIPETWVDRGHRVPEVPVEDLILVPDNSQYYAAYGAVIFGIHEATELIRYRGLAPLQSFISEGRTEKQGPNCGPALLAKNESLETFLKQYQPPTFVPARYEPGSEIRGYIGIDGGSTSSKAVLLDEQDELLYKAYQLSKGNPIQDAKELLDSIKRFATEQQCTLRVLGCGVTGYAGDVLEAAMQTDANIVETIAHMMSAQKYCGDDIDVICDIGGQDIKVLFMQNGTIKNFRLSNQCSAGNGMLLQAMADQFGVKVQEFAEVAYKATIAPRFSYGCAVFLDTDRVNFQKEGFNKEELFSGLAQVLPKNVWQYVVQVARMSELGRKFVLQGGTQYNMAAVKAQVDYIKQRVPDAQVLVHPHCGEGGAIGAALEAKRVVERRGHSTFIDLDAAINLVYTTRTDETTRCSFCDNLCSRSFIDIEKPAGGITRYIAGFSCEKGMVESKAAVVALHKERKRLQEHFPNLVEYEAERVFKSQYQYTPLPEAGTPIMELKIERLWFGYGPVRRKWINRGVERSHAAMQERRSELRIGIPRVLNHYTVAPFLRVYLEVLGIRPRNVVFSDETSEDMYIEGGKYGSIDPCYPSKVSPAHVYNLLRKKRNNKAIDYIWFPCITGMDNYLTHVIGSSTCPTLMGAPNVAKAAFTKEKDFFAEAGVEYVDRAISFERQDLLTQQLLESWGERLGITRDENEWAVKQGLSAMQAFDHDMQQQGRALLDKAERDNSMVMLLLGRPYHNDPGINHAILNEFQSLGYPFLSIRSIPKDPVYLQRFFAADIQSGLIEDVFDCRDVWPENYSVNSAQKVWAAKFAARHPNVAVLDLSNFKCGHDAPIYGIIDKIMAVSKTPYMALHDLDANKPGGSIKIRVKTFAYSLERYCEDRFIGNGQLSMEPMVLSGDPGYTQAQTGNHTGTLPEKDHTTVQVTFSSRR
ncbi:MAG: acyl-CoA dehydratase activase-related protein [Gammaproteobacteria bacterium]|nr:acyl-CoA dehydratase activase-related protein [Gammaproteobacteria bacterium]MDH5650245.1 acyl-CoA dehydratase activase-related protein [Gammaproteobacteria bacterium]